MKKVRAILLGGTFLLLGLAAWAQEFPRAELTFDYSFLRFNPVAAYAQAHNLNGGGGEIKVNINYYLGILMDLQGYGASKTNFAIPAGTYFTSAVSGTVSGNMFTYMFGPQIKVRAHGLHPFGQLLFGAAHTNAYGSLFKQICQPIAGECGFKTAPADDAFAMSFGGGVDVPINKSVSLRPGEIDYLLTRFTNRFTNSNQSNFRYSAGVVFTFGNTH